MARKSSKSKRKKFRTPGSCYFCDKNKVPSYKEDDELKLFITERAKVFSRSRSGLCAKHQRKLAVNIKRARFLGLLPFAIKV